MIDRRSIDLLFNDTVFREHLCSYGVPVEEHRRRMEECVLRVLSESMNKRTMIEHARLRGIKNYKNISKHALLEALWSPVSLETSTERCEKKKERKKKKKTVSFGAVTHMEPVVERIHEEVAVQEIVVEREPQIEEHEETVIVTPAIVEDSSRCSLCLKEYTETKCCRINRYCETKSKYTEDRVPNAVYDSFYERWLPVRPNLSQYHYSHIETKRTRLRCFDIMRAKRTQSESTMYKSFVDDLQKYYPSLMTQRQRDFVIGYELGVMVESIDDDMVKLMPLS